MFNSTQRKPLVLDGGLGMQLIHDGFKYLDQDPLWSAKLAYEQPEVIEQCHLR